MNEIKKPNDILVSTLTNGKAEVQDLISNGINVNNTQLLDPDSYRNLPFVKRAFADEKGNFREDMFTAAYKAAAEQYQELADVRTYDNVTKYIEYNKNDIFAPIQAKKANVSYEITPEKNPQHRSHGVSSLFEYGTATKSMRELAQQSKIWDSENQKWLDQTAEDRSILESAFGQSLVYATWDEDGVHEDPLTGRKIQHKKGDWKLNDKGQYYTETLGDRPGYGKQFVAFSDTLTKEDSALNKIDVFDSDDLEKSVVGTTVKAALKIAPYIFPQSRLIWGGLKAALELSKVMPGVLKMGEGIIMGGDAEDESAFTRSMNRWEGYLNKFQESKSDKGSSAWSYESIADMVTDTVSQLYQMRAIGSMSKFLVKDPTQQALAKLQKEILPQQIAAAGMAGKPFPNFTQKEINDLVVSAVQKMPEVKKAIETQSAVSKALSSGYMALVSTSDVFQDALAGGYDRRTAGLAGIAAAAGQFFLMNNTELGDWMLDKTVGYSRNADRATLLKAIRPFYDDAAKAVDKLGKEASKQEKDKILGKFFKSINKGINKAWDTIKEDGSVYWHNALVEMIEEVSEEAMMDATKGVFDTLSWAGFGKNPNASFGIAQEFSSGSFLERYAQAAFGGFLGGAIFEVQQKKIEPFMQKLFYGQSMEDIQPSLIHEIANGKTQDIYKIIDELAELDNEVAGKTTDVEGESYFTSANGTMTRGQVIGNVLKQWVSVLEGAVIDENANLTDDQLLQKTIRDFEAIKLMKEGGLDKLLISDFSKLTSQIATIKLALAKKEEESAKKEKKSDKEEKETAPTEKEVKEVQEFDDGKYDNKSEAFLKAALEKKRKELKEFLDGKKGEEYLYKTLAGATPDIAKAVGKISLYQYTYLKYNMEYKDLPKEGDHTKKSVKEEYEKWQKESNATKKYLTLGVDAYNDFDKRFAQYVVDYIETEYKDVREVTYAKLLSGERALRAFKKPDIANGNFNFTGMLDNDQSYALIRSLANAMKVDNAANSGSLAGVTLKEVFKQDVLKLEKTVSQIYDQNPQFFKILTDNGKTRDEIINHLSLQLQHFLEQVSIESLQGTGLGGLMQIFLQESLDSAFDAIIERLPNITLGELQRYMLEKGYINTPIANTNLDNADVDYLREQFKLAVATDIASDLNIGLSTSVLQEYLMSEETIDGTIANRIEERALEMILEKAVQLSSNADYNQIYTISDFEGDFIVGSVLSKDYKLLIDALNNEFGTKPLEEIVKNFTDEVSKDLAEDASKRLANGEIYESKHGLKEEHAGDPEKVSEFIQKRILDQLTKVPEYQIYKSISGKQIKQNPIFDSLSKIEMHLSAGGPSKVIEVLKKQHYKIRKAERFEDYMPKGEEKVQLEKALDAIEMYKALVSGMRKTSLGLGNPFGINQQMARFLEKNGIKSEREYQTIDEDAADLILSDLDIIEQQIRGYLKLGERAYSSKTEEDLRIKDSYSKRIREFIDAKASAFTIDDFSLLPTDEEKAKYKTPEEIAAFYAHTIHKKFHERFKTPEEKAQAIHQIVEKLGLKDTLTRSSKPTNLTREVTVLNEYDQLLWLATTLGADQFEFYHRYNQLVVGSEKSKLVPLFSQEMAALQAWSFSRSKNEVKSKTGQLVSVHDAILQEVLKADSNYIPTYNTIMINGITGAGKSSAVSAIVNLLNSDKLTYVTAANETQRAKYHEHLKKRHPQAELLQTGSITDLMGKFLTKDGKAALVSQIKATRGGTMQQYVQDFADPIFQIRRDAAGVEFLELNTEKLDKLIDSKLDERTIPELIFIDEATQVDAAALQVLSYLSSKYGIKLILSGDTTQRGIKQFGDPMAFKDLFMWQTAKLNLSVRSASSQKSANNVGFNSLLEIYESLSDQDPKKRAQLFSKHLQRSENHQVISYFQNDTTFTGDKFIESFDDAAEDLKLISQLSSAEKSKVMVITKLDENLKPVNQGIVSTLAQAGFSPEQLEFFSYEDVHAKAVQGSESPYVIVDDSYLAEDLDNPGEMLRSVYTLASRSLKGTLMVLPLKKQQEIGLINRKDRFTQIDEVPQLANLEKIKTARQEFLKNLLNGYTPEELELGTVETMELDGKTVGKRKHAKTPPKQTVKTASVVQTTSEDELTKEEQEEIIPTLSTEISVDPAGPVDPQDTEKEQAAKAEKVNISAQGQYTEEYDENKPVRWYSALDHLGVPLMAGYTNVWDPKLDRATNLDMDGMFDPNRAISSYIRTGFIRFRQAIASASSKEDIVNVIATDQHVAAFLYDAVPRVYMMRTGSATTDFKNEQLRSIYSEWFSQHVDIDDNYYVFGKKLNWKIDNPSNTVNADETQSVREGNTVLYFGVKLKSKDPGISGPLFHQYISLGTLSKREHAKKSQSYQSLYDRADQDLEAAAQNVVGQQEPFVAYRLEDTKLYEAKLSSTLWIRKVTKEGAENRFESVAEMQRRGFHVDMDSLYLVDSSKIEFGGKQEYKALVLAAILGYTASDVNPKTGKTLTLQEKVEALKEVFVDKQTQELRISGSYMTIAQSTLMGRDNTDKLPAYQRVIFLNPKKNNIKDVFQELSYAAGVTFDKHTADWRSRLSKCRPASQTKIITEILTQVGVFSDNGKDTSEHLLKYLIGWRDQLQKLRGDKTTKFQHDLDTLQALIAWVQGNIKTGQLITRDDFYNKMTELGHRALLMPFFRAFISTETSGAYQIVNLKSLNPLVQDSGDLKYNVTGKTLGHIKLNLSAISDSYSCPPLERSNDAEQNVIQQLVNEGIILPPDAPQGLSFNMYKIHATEKTVDELGMYGYELQSPVYSIDNNLLENATHVEYTSLERASNTERWPERKEWGRVQTVAPDGFDPKIYRPEQLPESAFIVDAEYGKKYVHTVSRPVKDDKGKDVYEEVDGYWSAKDKKPIPLPANKEAAKRIRKTHKIIKVKRKKFQKDKFTGQYVRTDGFRHQYINKQGFEVRIGDLVQIWGDETTSVRIVGLDKTDSKNVLIKIDAVFDGSGSLGTMSKLPNTVDVPVDAVTKVVSRRVAEKAHIKLDYYTKGVWKISNPLEEGKYAQQVKSGDTVSEIIEDLLAGGYNSAFDFDTFYYRIVPIYNMPSVDEGRSSYLSHPNGIKGHERTGSRTVKDIQELYEAHSDLLDGSEEGIQGYTVYQLRRDSYDESNPTGLLDAMVENIESKGSSSQYIKHQIFFDANYVTEIQDNIDRANPSTFYSHTKTAAKMTPPSALPISLDKDIDMSECVKYRATPLIFSQTDWNNRGSSEDFEEEDFIRHYNPTSNNWELYPHPLFYYRKPGGKYKYTSKENGAITYKDWDEFINNSGFIDGRDTAKAWEHKLKGLVFQDRQFGAYNHTFVDSMVASTGSQSKDKSKLKAEQKAARHVLPDTVEIREEHVSFSTASLSTVTAVEYNIKTQKYLVKMVARDGYEYQIDLADFLISLGSRFLLDNSDINAKVIESQKNPQVQTIDETEELVESTPVNTEESSAAPTSSPTPSTPEPVSVEPEVLEVEETNLVMTDENKGDNTAWAKFLGTDKFITSNSTGYRKKHIAEILLGLMGEISKEKFDFLLNEVCYISSQSALPNLKISIQALEKFLDDNKGSDNLKILLGKLRDADLSDTQFKRNFNNDFHKLKKAVNPEAEITFTC